MLAVFLKTCVKHLPGVGVLVISIALPTAFLVLFLVAGLFYLRRKRFGRPTFRRFSDPTTCLKILQGKTYDTSLGINRLTFEESRAIPNQRLVRAFRIDNGFTTIDPAHAREFRGKASQTLRDVTRGDWNRIGIKAHGFARTYFENHGSQNRGRLGTIVQIVTLKVVLSVFFEVEEGLMTDEAMLGIAENINLLWIQSKSSAGSRSGDFRILEDFLKRLGLDWANSKDNPLNMLLPVYETLWRVVANCLVEVVFRPSADPEWYMLLKAFRANPTSEHLSRPRFGQDGVSVEFLVKEALRLYPPTRRIYRQVHLASKRKSELVAADIEKCHRLPQVWGEDSHRYRRARWTSADKSMHYAFMPFGGNPWICPANAKFGPMMIGVLVAAFASTISAKDWELQLQSELPDGSSRVLDDDMELDSNRGENTAWMIIRRSG
ncbi:MAG: hypothetical protein Q9208_004447 [Pyrenodesmia sp. 3 TL-2023]